MNGLIRFSEIKIVLEEGSTITSYAHGSFGLTDRYVFLQFDKPSYHFQHRIIPREKILYIGFDEE